MTASLLIAGIEVIDPAAGSNVTLAAGSGSGSDFDFGEGVPDQATIASLYLDGDEVMGERTANRQLTLPLNITGATVSDRSATVDKVRFAVAADSFTVQWTPDGGLPVIFDAFRATVTRVRDADDDAAGIVRLLITCPAKPFGRSPAVETVSAPSGIQVDSFDTAPTGATLSTTHKIEGTGSAQYSNLALVSRTFAAKDLSAYSSITLRNYIDGDSSRGKYQALFYVTLTSSGGSTQFSMPRIAQQVPGRRWVTFAIPLTGGTITAGTGVDLTAVTGYSIRPNIGTPPGAGAFSGLYLDDMRASGTAAALSTTTHGANLLLPAVSGSARTPANLAVTNGATFDSFLLHSPPPDQDFDLAILNGLSGSSTDQTITIAAANCNYDGTYSLVLGVDTVGGGSVTVVVTAQQQTSGGNVGYSTVLTRTYTSGPKVIPVGEITLPLYAVTQENTTTSITFRVQITGADRYTELMLCDTTGQTVLTDVNMSAAHPVVYVDEPDALTSGPKVFSAVTDRTDTHSILDRCLLSGGPIVVDPGQNKVLAWTGAGTPTVTATYYPRWLDERVAQAGEIIPTGTYGFGY